MAHNNKQYTYSFPMCRQQKDFEDLAKELVKIMADMEYNQQIEVFEYAQKVYADRNNKYKNGRY